MGLWSSAMNRRTLVKAALAASLSIGIASPALSVDADQARRHVQATSDQMIALVNDDTTVVIKREKFKELLKSVADVDYISRLTIGRPWRQMSDTQKQAYTSAFIGYVSNRFAKSFNDFRGGALTIRSAEPAPQSRRPRILVKSVGERAGAGQPTDIEWLVGDVEGQPRIVDVKIETLSLVISQRSEITTLLNSVGGDVDKLIEKLKNAADDSI